jgi:hypothetical protein
MNKKGVFGQIQEMPREMAKYLFFAKEGFFTLSKAQGKPKKKV